MGQAAGGLSTGKVSTLKVNIPDLLFKPVLLAGVHQAAAQGAAFTYQGLRCCRDWSWAR